MLFPALLAATMLGGLILALFGAGVWDFIAYVLIAPTLALVALVASRTMRALARSDDAPPIEANPSAGGD
jgi:predicted lipid-binding transport protein (Tim44 family)